MIWSRGQSLFVSKFWNNNGTPFIVNANSFLSSIVSFASGPQGWLYIGLADGSMFEYVVLDNTVTNLINAGSISVNNIGVGISFVRTCGTNVYALYSDLTMTKLNMNTRQVVWSVNLSSTLPFSSSSSIVEVYVQDSSILILTSSILYQLDEKNPSSSVQIVYNLSPIQKASTMTVSQGYAFIGASNDISYKAGVYAIALGRIQ